MQQFFKDNNVKIYHSNSHLKAVVIERFNRTLRELMMKEFVKNNNTIYYNILPKLIKIYNNRISNESTYDVDIDFSNDDMFDIDFSCIRVKQFLDNININKAPGPDGIHGCVLKYCSISLCRPLSIIFRLSFNTGSIPAELKSANIVPVHKKGEKNLINNYRPISLTCLTAKIMEHIIQEELLSKTQNLINSAQHGFLLGRSCDTNLITLTDDIASSLHNDTGIDIIYFDFAKAFDTVNHNLLLYKLKNCYKIDA